MKVTNFGPGGLPTALGGWSAGVMSIGSNATVQGGLTATNFVQLITANSSNTLLRPIANFAAGNNISLSVASNTITITGTGSLSGGYPDGTAFPGSPVNNQKFFHNTYDMLFFYDGTRWLCTCPHTIPVAMQHALLTVSATNSHRAALGQAVTSTVWLQTLDVSIYVVTTNDGTNYWTVGLSGFGSAVSTQSLAPNTSLRLSSTLNLVLTIATTALGFQVDFTKVASPGAAYPIPSVTYRYIGT